MISFAELSFSVTDIGFDVMVLMKVPLEKCSHRLMALPMGGVCVVQQGSYYWLISLIPKDLAGISAVRKKKPPSVGVSL